MRWNCVSFRRRHDRVNVGWPRRLSGSFHSIMFGNCRVERLLELLRHYRSLGTVGISLLRSLNIIVYGWDRTSGVAGHRHAFWSCRYIASGVAGLRDRSRLRRNIYSGFARIIVVWDWASTISGIAAQSSCDSPGGHLHRLGSQQLYSKICFVVAPHVFFVHGGRGAR